LSSKKCIEVGLELFPVVLIILKSCKHTPSRIIIVPDDAFNHLLSVFFYFFIFF